MNIPAAVLSVSLLGTPIASYGTVPNCSSPPVTVAHRGGNELYTENTIGAFATSGAPVWETDVRFDVKNVPVILHDETVDRTTAATGPIAALQASGSVRIATDDGQRIPTEWEVLDLARQRGARVLLELKVMPANSAQWGAFFNRIDITVGRSSITVASFDTDVLAAVRERDPSVRTALIQGSGYISAADVLAQGVSFEKQGTSITQSRYDEWAAAGIELFAWTLDDPTVDGWARMLKYPVAGVITDKPLAFAAWVREQCGP